MVIDVAKPCCFDTIKEQRTECLPAKHLFLVGENTAKRGAQAQRSLDPCGPLNPAGGHTESQSVLLTQRAFELGISLALPTRSDESELGARQHRPLRWPRIHWNPVLFFSSEVNVRFPLPPSRPLTGRHQPTWAMGLVGFARPAMTVLSEITMAMMSLRRAAGFWRGSVGGSSGEIEIVSLGREPPSHGMPLYGRYRLFKTSGTCRTWTGQPAMGESRMTGSAASWRTCRTHA